MSNIHPKDYFVDFQQLPNCDVTFVWEIIATLNEYLASLIKNSGLPEAEKVDLKGLNVNYLKDAKSVMVHISENLVLLEKNR